MKMLIVITAIAGTLGITAPALANTTCSWIGDFWVCQGDGGQSTCNWIGDFWVCQGDGGQSTCNWIGDYWVCN